MKKTPWKLLLLILVAGVLIGFIAGRLSSGIEYANGQNFLAYAAPEPRINSAFSARLLGVTSERVYLHYWSAVRFLGREHTVIWTYLSELPPNLVAELQAGKDPWREK